MRRRVLFLGGTGAVGSRVARLLSDLPELRRLIAGRDGERCEHFVEDLLADGVAAEAVQIAVPTDLARLLREQRPELVIDCTGSFGKADARTNGHAVARACIAAGLAYIDVADSRSHVLGIRALDELAIASGARVHGGAGLVPCLSMAACEALAQGLAQVRAVRVMVCPGNQEPHGHAALAGMLADSGASFQWRREGAWRKAYAWQGLTGSDIAGVGPRLLSAWNAPDLDLLPERWPELTEATVQGSVEVAALHRGLAALGWLRRLGVVREARGLCSAAETIARSFSHFGSDRFGMRVEMEGQMGPHRVRRSWTLHAPGGGGAWVKAAPAAALARALLSGQSIQPGARVATLTLTEILAELRAVPTDIRVTDMDD